MTRLRTPVVALVTALVTAVFVVPRPHTPRDVPYPQLDASVANAEYAEIAERARDTARTGLHVDIRGIGERLRRVSRLETSSDRETYLSERARLRLLVQGLLRDQRERELLALRDVQTMLFVEDLHEHWRKPSAETEASVRELGANVLSYLDAAKTWLPTHPHLDPTLAALFIQRWADVLNLEQHLLLAPSANAQRLIQRFLIAYQLNKGAKRDNQQLLALLSSVPDYSPDYPSEYARGIVFYQMGAFTEAIAAFERHLSEHPDGAWAGRAHNFRLEAIRASAQ